MLLSQAPLLRSSRHLRDTSETPPRHLRDTSLRYLSCGPRSAASLLIVALRLPLASAGGRAGSLAACFADKVSSRHANSHALLNCCLALRTGGGACRRPAAGPCP